MKKIVIYNITDKLVITQKLTAQIINGKATGVYEYYIGERFVFGVLEPFNITDLIALYRNGYFDIFIKEI